MARSPSPVGRSPFRMAVRLFCYAVLAVSTWCGPIPWMHCHAAATPDGALQGHIALHHNQGQQAPRGWHFHLLLLTELGTTPCGPDCPEHEREPSVPVGLPLAYGVSIVAGQDGAQQFLSHSILDFALPTEVVSLVASLTSAEPREGSTGSVPAVDRAAFLCVARC